MGFTYTGNPKGSPRDAVRLLVGDIDSSDPLLGDDEIEWFIAEFPESHYWAAAMACETIASHFAREVSVSADGISFSGDQIGRNFFHRAEALRKMHRNKNRYGLPYVGGISWKERLKADQDSDKIPTHFRSHMHDHPQTGTQSGAVHNPLVSEQ